MIFMPQFNHIDRQNVIQKQNNPQQKKTFTLIVQYSNKIIVIYH